jgi:outer membrane protein TolC
MRGARPRALLECAFGVLAILLAGCRTLEPAATAPSPTQPWTLPESVRADVTKTIAQVRAEKQRRPATGAGTSDAARDPEHAYRLDELIDLAQRNNPETRVAWEAAREAALAVGVARSTLLPRLAVSVVGGYQELSTPIQVPFIGERTLTTEVRDVAPMLTLEWLLFDFGARDAAVQAAKHLTTVANVEFNQVHQQLIFDVSQAYHGLLAATEKRRAAARALAAARELLDAAVSGEARGVGTRLEVAQARQQVAQAQMALTSAEGEGESARVALNAALGLPQATRLALAPRRQGLPRLGDRSLDQIIERALVRRPDLIAAVASLRAAEADVDLAKTGFRPKVGAIGSLATNANRFRLNSSGALGTPLEQTGILVGVTWPLTEGGLRQSRLHSAYARVRAAQAEVAALTDAAAAEIATAAATLRTALATARSAQALVDANQVTVDAARKGLAVGYGSVTEAAAAEKALMEAEELLADARRDAFAAATELAFVTAAAGADAHSSPAGGRSRPAPGGARNPGTAPAPGPGDR